MSPGADPRLFTVDHPEQLPLAVAMEHPKTFLFSFSLSCTIQERHSKSLKLNHLAYKGGSQLHSTPHGEPLSLVFTFYRVRQMFNTE